MAVSCGITATVLRKTKGMCIEFRKKDNPLLLVTSEGEEIELVTHSKLLGVTVQSDL